MKENNINLEEYKILGELGKGGFGNVFKLEKDNKYYALKKISISFSTKEKIDKIQEEIKILSSFDNKYIVKYYGSIKEKDFYNILMEFAGNSNMKQFINNYKDKNCFIEEKLIKYIIIQISSALKEIHKANLIHRDLSPDNIFINEKKEIKIGDFGISKRLDPNNNYAQSITGKFKYFAPEIIKGIKYNNKVDIYAFGCIIYELFTLNEYYIDKIIEKKEGKINIEIYNPKWQTLIDLLLIDDYHKRPTAEEIYNYVSNSFKVKEYDLYGKLIYEGDLLNGKKCGKGKEYDFLNDQLEYDGEFSNGKYDGKGRKYYKGKLNYDGEYKEGKKNGKGKEYDYKGILRFEGIYLNGVKWSGKGFDDKGNEVYKIKEGKGYYKEYNFFNGNLIYEGEYLNGERNGKGKEYNNNELIFEGEFLKGKKKNGKGKYYEYGYLIYFGEFIDLFISLGKMVFLFTYI